MSRVIGNKVKFLHNIKKLMKIWSRTKSESNKNERTIIIKKCDEEVYKTAKKIRTMQELIDYLMLRMKVHKSYFADLEPREHLMDLIPKTQEELEPRTMRDSFSRAIIPLSTDIAIQDKYVGHKGYTRIGRILEDLDMFACYVLLKHCKLPKVTENVTFPYYLVTACVDKIDFVGVRPLPQKDLLLSGHISHVGKSSAEIIIIVGQERDGVLKKITKALFVMAARNPLNTGGGIINPLIPKTDNEKLILKEAEERKRIRENTRFTSLFTTLPTPEEQATLHKIFLQTIVQGEISPSKSILPANSIWAKARMLTSFFQAHPEHRNINNTVFGGFIMRQAHELSWNLAILFSNQQRPRLKRISDIKFIKPIQLNSFIKMSGTVIYTKKNYMVIRIFAEVLKTFEDRFMSNEVYFTYQVPDQLPLIVPKSYKNAILFLQGKRHLKNFIFDYPKFEKSGFFHDE